MVHPKCGMLLMWIMQWSDWADDNVRIIHDAGMEDWFYDISSGRLGWENRENDFIKSFNDFLTAEKTLRVDYKEYVIE